MFLLDFDVSQHMILFVLQLHMRMKIKENIKEDEQLFSATFTWNKSINVLYN